MSETPPHDLVIPATHAQLESRVREAFDRSTPFGRARAGDAGAAVATYPLRAFVRGRLAELLTDPEVSEPAVAEHYAARGALPMPAGYRVFRSAGKTGEYGYFLYDEAMWRSFVESVAWHMRLCGIDDRDRVAFVGTRDPRHTLPRLAADLCLLAKAVFGMQQPLPALSRDIETFAPTALVGFSSALYLLARRTLERGLALRPAKVLCNTDSLTTEFRETMRRAWEVEPREAIYGTELGLMLFECPHGRVHANTSLIAFRERDGRLLGTNLVNLIQPIVDLECPLPFVFEADACACGVGHPVVRPTGAGRVVRPLELPGRDGGTVELHPIVLREMLDTLPDVAAVDWRIEEGALVLFGAGTADAAPLQQALHERLREHDIDVARLAIRIRS